MVGVALLGAGIFALEQHVPAIQATSSFEFKAIYSRSQKSAEALAALVQSASPIDVYYDSPDVEGKSLDALLQRSDISAVVIALPILVQPAIIKRAITAGKHVLSEKPVAKDVAEAQSLIAWYSSLSPSQDRYQEQDQGQDKDKPLWAVAENWRYLESVLYAAKELQDMGGEVVSFRLQRYGFVKKGDKYFETEWRKIPEYQGGFLLDGGVHFIAALRYLLAAAAAGTRIARVACFSALLQEHLVPVDTVNATAVTDTGCSGIISMTFATEFKRGTEVEIVTTKGSVLWTPVSVKVVKDASLVVRSEVTKEFGQSTGVVEEMAAFAAAIEQGKLDERQTPLEALRDLEVLQRLLESGEENATVKAVEL